MSNADSIKELDDLYVKLEELKKDFNIQLNNMEGDLNEFHKILINLTKKYPEHSELLEFIVLINDNLRTNQTQYKQIISDVINKLIVYKQTIITNYNRNNKYIDSEIDAIEKNEENDKDNRGFLNTLLDSASLFKDIKWTVMFIMVTVLIIGAMHSPNEVKIVLKSIMPMIVNIQEEETK